MGPTIVDLAQERSKRRPPGAPPTGDLHTAIDLIRDYAAKLLGWSVDEYGMADIACGDLCCFADCVERVAQMLDASE